LAFLLLPGLTTLAEPKRVTFEGASPEFKWPLQELNAELPSDWSPYEFLVMELRASSPQSVNLKLFNGDVTRSARMNFFPGAWIRAAVPLAYYRTTQRSGFDMASMGNKPRSSFWMGVGRPSGPLDNVQAIGVQMNRPVGQPSLEIRSVQLAREDPGDTVLEPKPLVDEFGQWIPADWPDKAKSLEDLKHDWAKEQKSLFRRDTNYCPYGGYLNTKGRATGFFRVEQIEGTWWLIDPDGHLFLSVGMDCVVSTAGTRTRGREGVFAELPPADVAPPNRVSGRGPQASFYTWNLTRRFGSDWRRKWIDLTIERLDSWGFNTIANWSDPAVGATHQMPSVATLDGWGLETGWMGLPDVYSSTWESTVEQAAARQCDSRKADPWLLGYFVANEPPWPGKEAQLTEMILQGPENASQRELIAFLAHGDTPQRRTQFVYHAFERMLEVINAAIRRHDPNHLNLGIRFGGKPADEIVRLAHVFDVYSQNIYAHAPDTKSLDRIYELTGRPMIVGEFHIGTPGRGLAAGLVQVRDQEERAVAYRYYVETAAAHPALIGTHWFQWLDEPPTGRMDGENYNIGFVDVTDRPYAELVTAAKLTHQRLLGIHSGKEAPVSRQARVQ
jgi:hypothetical protein